MVSTTRRAVEGLGGTIRHSHPTAALRSVEAIREAGLTIPNDLIREPRRVAKAIVDKFKTGLK